MLKKFPLEKITSQKCSFFSQPPTHRSFTFNLRLLCKPKRKFVLSKNVCGIFHFRFRFAFIKIQFLVRSKERSFWLYNAIAPSKIKMIEKAHRHLLADLNTTGSFKIQ